MSLPDPDQTLGSPKDQQDDWKGLKLSLERPYKDDKGEKIRTLLDIENDKFIFEEKESQAERLKTNFHRIFQERGIDFFHDPDKRFATIDTPKGEDPHEGEEVPADKEEEEKGLSKHMTLEELNAMRKELVPNLLVALGEMTQARDILNSLLSSVQTTTINSILSNLQPNPAPAQAAPTNEPALTTTTVNKVLKPSPVTAIQAFDTQIVIGSKDEALRKAAGLFDSAATSIEKNQERSEFYWLNALKIRQDNWRLLPAPLPPGSFVGKGGDRTAKDLLISYGLEESPMIFRRRALASLSEYQGEGTNEIVFPSRQNTRIQISLRTTLPNGQESISTNTYEPHTEEATFKKELARAQTEIIDQEIFTHLVKEATALPTILPRVSERSIAIDAGEGIEIKFELLKDEDLPLLPVSPICDIIYHGLHILLLRKHGFHKSERLNMAATPGSIPYSPPILLPIIDYLQYNLFCEKLESELSKAARGVRAIGIPAAVTFNGVGETGEELVQIISEPQGHPISGEAILTIDERHTVRFTFMTPSILMAHLSQATIQVYSMTQLSQVLTNEIERFLLHRICRLGEKLRGGTWLVDLDHLVARWEGCVLTFQLFFEKDLGINFSAFRLDKKTGRRGNLYQYSRLSYPNVPLLSWVEEMIMKVPQQ